MDKRAKLEQLLTEFWLATGPFEQAEKSKEIRSVANEIAADRNVVMVMFTDTERDALQKLAKEKELSPEAIIRQGLRLYQLVAQDPSRLRVDPPVGCSGE